MISKNIIIRGLTLLTFIFTISCMQILSQNASPKSDKEKRELAGRVLKIKTELVYFKRDGDKWVEDGHIFASEYEFDVDGKIIKSKEIPLFGSGINGACRYPEIRDERGRITELHRVCDSKEVSLEKYTYEDDKYGNWIKQYVHYLDEKTQEVRRQNAWYREIEYFK